MGVQGSGPETCTNHLLLQREKGREARPDWRRSVTVAARLPPSVKQKPVKQKSSEEIDNAMAQEVSFLSTPSEERNLAILIHEILGYS